MVVLLHLYKTETELKKGRKEKGDIMIERDRIIVGFGSDALTRTIVLNRLIHNP